MVTDSFAKIFKDKKRVMVVMAHPDDAEILAGGTIARLIQSGIRVRVVRVTSGNKGSRQDKVDPETLAKKRRKENSRAMIILGISSEDRIGLDVDDGSVENNLEIIGKIVRQIRLFKPDLIITHNPDNFLLTMENGQQRVIHRDHRNTGRSTIDAIYPYSRDLLFFPEHFHKPSVSPHLVTEVLLAECNSHPNGVTIDITRQIDLKIKALSCHLSQYKYDEALADINNFTLRQKKRFLEKFLYLQIV